MSEKKYKVQVQADDTRTWAGNGLVFDTPEEAVTYAKDLFSRWSAVREWRVIDDTGHLIETR